MTLVVPRDSVPNSDRIAPSGATQDDPERIQSTLNAATGWSFALCLTIWILPLEADLLMGLVQMFPFAWVLLGHLLVTCLIFAPLINAVRQGVPARRLLSSLRVWTVLVVTAFWATIFATGIVHSIRNGTFFTAPPLPKKSINSGQN